MIRNLYVSPEVGTLMREGESAMEQTNEALIQYFRQKVYPREGVRAQIIHRDLMDEDIQRIVRAGFQHSQPHLHSLIDVHIIREHPAAMVCNVAISLSAVQANLQQAQAGTYFYQ